MSAPKGNPVTRTFGELHKGQAMAMLGEMDAALTLARRAIAERVAIGINHTHAGYLSALANACGRVGRVREGLSLIEEALMETETRNDRLYEPKSYRIKGDLLLLQDRTDGQGAAAQQEAEACFCRAIELARHQQAKLWEARALASLCRLLHSQGQDEGCRQQLAELCAWFTDGFQTEDLRVVRAVLEEIG